MASAEAPHWLKTRAQFQAALKSPPVARTAHFALHRLHWSADAQTAVPSATKPLFTPASGTWLGAMTPKRWARRAVTRNAIRRQVRALGHEQAGNPAGGWPASVWLVRLRAEFDRNQFPGASSLALKRAVRGELRKLFARALQAQRPPGPPEAPAS